MIDYIFITFFVLAFSYLHSLYNQRNKTDKYYIFILTEIAFVLSYIAVR